MDSDTKHHINSIIDKLTLESLSLMEQHILVKLELENSMIAGENNLAKARYIMGQNKVSQLQLPNLCYPEFHAMTVVNSVDNNDWIQDNPYDLEFKTTNNSGKDNNDTNARKDNNDTNVINIVNPINWFGVLVPQCLHSAQSKFKHTLHWSVKAANIHRKLSDCLCTISKLNKYVN